MAVSGAGNGCHVQAGTWWYGGGRGWSWQVRGQVRGQGGGSWGNQIFCAMSPFHFCNKQLLNIPYLPLPSPNWPLYPCLHYLFFPVLKMPFIKNLRWQLKQSQGSVLVVSDHDWWLISPSVLDINQGVSWYPICSRFNVVFDNIEMEPCLKMQCSNSELVSGAALVHHADPSGVAQSHRVVMITWQGCINASWQPRAWCISALFCHLRVNYGYEQSLYIL